MMLTGLLAVLTLLLKCAPDAPLGRRAHTMLVAWPLAWLSTLELRHLIFFAVMAGFMMSGGEILMLAGPELVTSYALELSFYLDAVLVTYALSILSQARFAGQKVRAALIRTARRFRPRNRVRRTRRPGILPSANDDEAHPALKAA